VINVARGLEVYPKTIEAAVLAELPFMATEEILMAGVAAGGDRQDLHERIRKHSVDAGAQVKQHGRPNDLIDRLRTDPSFAKADLSGVMDPKRFVGRAPQQVDQFVAQVVEPIRRRYGGQLGKRVDLKV
jgi:adenylosuccinate lyase